MKIKKTIKIAYILIILFALLLPRTSVQAVKTTCPVCNGTGYQPGSNFTLCPRCRGAGTVGSSSTATINPDDYKPGDLTAADYNTPFQFAGTILNAIVIVGVVISVVSVMILGIKYMAGSVEERAEYKKTMMPMLIGMIMLFTTTTIVGIIYNLVANNLN